jgi:hypothetical protein
MEMTMKATQGRRVASYGEINSRFQINLDVYLIS